VRETGLRASQLALSPIIARPEWAHAAASLRRGGITVVSGMMEMRGEDYSTLESIARTGGVRPDGTWSSNLAHAQKVAQLAASLDLKLVTFHAGFLPHDRSSRERGVLLQRIRDLADLFAALGIGLGLETGQESAATLSEVLIEIDRRNVGVNFDPANMILYGMGDPIDALRRLGPFVRQVHIKDALPTRVPGTWGEEVPAGLGRVDWTAFFAAVAELPGPIDLVIEREAGDQRVADVRRAMEVVRTHGRSLIRPESV